MKKKMKQRVNSTKVEHDGIKFASGLEKYTYLALKEAKLFELYEGEQFHILEGFHPTIECTSRQANGKGEYTRRDSKKVLGISYRPDFTGRDYIIECKGRANDTFPLRFKLFKSVQEKNKDGRAIYVPQNRKEVDETVRLILEKRNE